MPFRETLNKLLASGIITTTRLLGITVIAEGIETREPAALLLSLGCRQFQGYLIAEAMPGTAMSAWLATWPTRRGKLFGLDSPCDSSPRRAGS